MSKRKNSDCKWWMVMKYFHIGKKVVSWCKQRHLNDWRNSWSGVINSRMIHIRRIYVSKGPNSSDQNKTRLDPLSHWQQSSVLMGKSYNIISQYKIALKTKNRVASFLNSFKLNALFLKQLVATRIQDYWGLHPSTRSQLKMAVRTGY